MSRKGSIGSTRSNSTISVSSIPINTNSNPLTKLHPCSTSSELVVYSQGSSILCLRHETLELERRFDGHTEDVTFISVDNCSGTLPSRVVSVDTSKTAIIWYLQTGEEISRFSSYDDIQTAAWMRNGNLTFGDSIGNVILFDPLRAESIPARTIFDPLVAIAPSSDCKSFALGYNNGSVLIAALSPSFTILHTLTTTSISPSSIVTLAWHASSSKQKSDMLAVQTRDGDLRVWSVPKSIEGDESARVVRVLKRVDGNGRGINWLGWSRNGRIVQYSAGTTYIWDVRTKTIEWEDVPTPNNVVGICIYGPKGALFTLGGDSTIQQFTLYPPQLLASVRHAPAFAPPSPPASIEEKKEGTEILHYVEETRQEDYMIAAPAPPPMPEQPIAYEPGPTEAMVYTDAGLGISNVQERRPSSVSSRSSTGSTSSQRERNLSVSSRGSGGRVSLEYSPATTASPNLGRKGSVSSMHGNESTAVSSPISGRKASIGAGSHTSRKLHPLRQEMHPSPDTPEATAPGPIPEVTDIFASLRARLSTVTYERPRAGGPQNRLSEDDLRKEMLFCIFGWRGDIEQLIGDELDSVNARSLNSLILRMWLGDLDQNSLSVMLGADFIVSGDWLFLALSAMGGQSSWAHVARAYVLKLLQKNDIHMAVLCLLAIGDKNDAVDIYVSHKCYLEALLLTTLLWKSDWKRISTMARKWGEYAAANSDGALAARCFACAGTEAPERSQAERPQRSRTPSHSRSRSENESAITLARKLSISSPTNPRATLKMTPKNAPLKLITDFAAPPEKDPIPRSQTTSPSSLITGLNRFFHPAGFPSRSATSTPIGMSALTPVDPFWAQRDPFPPSARAGTPGGAGGKLLTPVTESSPLDRTPIQRIGQELMAPAPPPPPPPPASLADLAPPAAPALVKGAKTQNISSPVEIRNSSGFSESQSITLGDFNKMERAPTPPQRYTPPPQTSSPVVPKRTRSMSLRSSNKPGGGGLHIQFPPMDQFLRSGTPAAGGEESKGHRRKDSRPSPPKEEDIGGFLDLLEKGQKRLDTQRAIPRTSSQLRRVSPERRRRSPEPERTYPRKMSVEREPRGRTQQVKRSHMRSPSSPLPFSPQAALYREDTAPVEIDSVEIQRPSETPQFNVPRYDEPRDRNTARDFNNSLRSPPSPTLSPEQAFHVHDEFNDERYYTSPRVPSRNRDRNRDQSRDRDRSRGRGRSRVKEAQGSHIRSPSSPLPMSPQALLYQEMSAAVDKQHEEEENSRSRRRPNRSQTRDHTRMDSRTRGPQFQQQHQSLRRSRSERTLRQWSEQLENGGHYSLSRADSPAPSTLSRNMSISRGLPSNPRAWRADLQVSSRGNSPVPSRGRSPVNVTRSMTPAHDRTMSPSARNFSPSGQRHLSPAPYRGRSPASRNTITPAPRERSPAPPLENRAFVPGPIEAPYESVPTPTTRTRYMSPQPAPYESIPTPLPSVTMTPAYESPISTHGRNLSPAPRNSSRNTSRARGRSGSRQREPLQQASPRPAVNPYYQSPSISTSEEIPPLPALSRSNSHKRNNSEPAFKPLIRKLPPMPLSPPPLPQDFPVHHALQMHLEPGKKKETGNNPKRTNRPEEMTPPQLDYDDEGWAGQYRNPDEYYEEMNRLQEMRVRHSKTPSQGSFGSRGLGTMNMI